MKEEEIDYAALIEDLLFGEKVKLRQIVELSNIDPETLSLLEGRWDDSDPERRRVIVQHMVDIVEEQDDYQYNFDAVFFHGLADSAAPVRLAAINGLWEADNPRWLNQFYRLAQSDSEMEIRVRAIHILGNYLLLAEWGEFPPERTEPIVAQFFSWLDEEETLEDIYLALVEVLPVTGDARIDSYLVRAYEHGDEKYLLSSVIGMANSNHERWGGILREELENEVEEIALAAIRGVGDLGLQKAVPDLINLSLDDNEEILIAVIRSLGRIGGDDARIALQNLLEEAEANENDGLLEWIEDSLAELEMVQMIGLEIDFDETDE